MIQILEYAGVRLLLISAGIVPLKALHRISRILGGLLYHLSSKRRNIAINNLREAFKRSKTESEIKNIARQSCDSLFLTFLEIIKSRSILSKHDSAKRLRDVTEGLDELFQRGKALEATRDIAMRQDPYFDYAQALLQIAIVLASVAIITKGTAILIASGLVGLAGTLLMLNGFTLAVAVPGLG